MLVQPSKTRLLGYKSRDDSKSGELPAARRSESKAESLSRLFPFVLVGLFFVFFSFSVPLLVSAVMLKAARCVFDCLCLREGSAGWLLLSVRRSLSLWFSPLINLSDNLSRSPPLCFFVFFSLASFIRGADSDSALSICLARHVLEVP